MDLFSIVGWFGVLFCTLGYLLLSLKVIKAEFFSFQALNIAGGLCLAITAIQTEDLPNAVANLLWMSIGLFAVTGKFRKRKADEA